jgi:pyruvate-ferredoxin/flavodoxin oxidoreductase
MGEHFQQEVSNGVENLWGEPVIFLEPESEHSSATACEGYALAGGRVSNFTSGQGLVLMKEVLYTISGKRLPVVFEIGARALTSQSLNVHAGHDDVMAVADCGWGMLFARNAQEAADLALISRRAAEDSETPFMCVQDGFLTTHTVESLRLPEPELMKQFVGHPSEKIHNMFDPSRPLMVGVVQNQDSYMKGKIAQRHFYQQVPGAVSDAMDEYYNLTGRRYRMVDPYLMDDAEYCLVGMGTMMETATTAADYMRAEMGIKVGVVHVTSFRPFPGPELVEMLRNVRGVSVFERMDNPIAQSNPLTAELKAAFADALNGMDGYPKVDRIPRILSGSAGLGSRDVRPGDFIAATTNMAKERPLEYFAVGIEHDLSLKVDVDPDVRPDGSFSMRGHSVGGFGSVTTNKIIATVMGEPDLFGLFVQAYPKYGSEKKGLPTTYYLTVGQSHIRTHSELEHVDFVVLNDVNAFNLGNPLSGLQEGGLVFIQSNRPTPEQVWSDIPEYAQQIILENKLRVTVLDTVEIARQEASRPDLVQRMQGIVLLGIFLKVTPFQDRMEFSDEQVFGGVEDALRKYFGEKAGEKVVQENLRCVKRGFTELMDLPADVMVPTTASNSDGGPNNGNETSGDDVVAAGDMAKKEGW